MRVIKLVQFDWLAVFESFCHQKLAPNRYRRHRRQCIVVDYRSVTPEWPRMVDLLHRSAGGMLLLSLHSWSIHRLLGRPGRRFQLWSGRWPRVRSTWHRSAWWAGVSSESLAMSLRLRIELQVFYFLYKFLEHVSALFITYFLTYVHCSIDVIILICQRGNSQEGAGTS